MCKEDNFSLNKLRATWKCPRFQATKPVKSHHQVKDKKRVKRRIKRMTHERDRKEGQRRDKIKGIQVESLGHRLVEVASFSTQFDKVFVENSSSRDMCHVESFCAKLGQYGQTEVDVSIKLQTKSGGQKR